MTINSKVFGSSVAAAIGFVTLSASILQLTGIKLETTDIFKIAIPVAGALVGFVMSRYFGRAEGAGKQ
jgi:hypothetical protein